MADEIPGDVTAAVAEVASSSLRSTTGRLVQSFAVYGTANFGIRALNFLLILVYAHYLRPSDYGIIYLAEIYAAFLILFGNLSIDSALQRLYFQHNNNHEELRSYLGSAIRFGIIAMATLVAFCVLVGGPIQRHLGFNQDVPFYPYMAMAITTAAATQGIQYRLAVYQAERRPTSYAFMSFLLFALTACLSVYGVVVLHRGAVGMLKGKLVAALLAFLVAAWKMHPLLIARFQWRFVRETLSFSLPLVPHQVMAGGLIVADRFILDHYRNLNEVGVYSVAYTMGMVMFLVTQSLSQAWLPIFFELARGDEDNYRVLGRIGSGLAILLLAIACLGILLSPSFIELALDVRYHAAIRLVPLVIMGYLFHAFFTLCNLSIMQANRTKFILLISGTAFTANMILNFVMIPRWGMYGAAWATTIAYAIEALIAYLFAQRFFVLSYAVPQILGGLTVAGGAIALTQSAWILKWNGLFAVLSTIVAFALLALIGKRDLRASLTAIRKTRKREVQQGR